MARGRPILDEAHRPDLRVFYAVQAGSCGEDLVFRHLNTLLSHACSEVHGVVVEVGALPQDVVQHIVPEALSRVK